MKKKLMKRLTALTLALAMALTLAACGDTGTGGSASSGGSTSGGDASTSQGGGTAAELLGMDSRPDEPAEIPEGLDIDWNHQYRYEEIEDYLQAMAAAFPDTTELYSIGRSHQERDLWCLEITDKSIPNENKTGIGVLANIHGGERESGASGLYTAWWFALNSTSDAYVQSVLDNYVIYVVPIINPDGYEQSFVINTRQNLRPRDLNGDGTPFSDPYTDIDGDGYIATLYRGTADSEPSTQLPRFGMESPDWDGNGILGDDPRNSGIDMNRTFNHQWNRYDIETDQEGSQVIGNNSFSSAGPGPATEPEIQALQQFMYNTPMHALATLHTGIQCVLYPWCYRPYDANNPDDADIPFMKETAAAMAQVYQDYTGRGFYTKSSYEDYPTSAELIDYAYDRLGIHAYTIEVYSPGKSESGDISECMWENTMPEPTWVFYSQEELTAMGLDPSAITDEDGQALGANEGLWFYTSSSAQMADKAPENQDIMVRGCRDSILTMIHSEPNGDGPQVPVYYK